LKEGLISNAIYHNTVCEFWFVLSGKGSIWRKNGEEESITSLQAGVSIDIPLGTHFQYRSDEGDLVFICVTIPPWSGPDEATYTNGTWVPTSTLE
jgi:mannose-6-phosphate isomerase-like protein (cupin superfamily)